MNIAIVCTAMLGFLLFGLGLYVSSLRGRTQRVIGYDTNDPADPLYRAVRAHGNTSEYAPFLAVLFLWFAMHSPPTWILVTIVLATIARFLLAAGLLWGSSLEKPNVMRFSGALFTYACGLALVVGLLRTAL